MACGFVFSESDHTITDEDGESLFCDGYCLHDWQVDRAADRAADRYDA